MRGGGRRASRTGRRWLGDGASGVERPLLDSGHFGLASCKGAAWDFEVVQGLAASLELGLVAPYQNAKQAIGAAETA